jgi:signal transduction histidine kinase
MSGRGKEHHPGSSGVKGRQPHIVLGVAAAALLALLVVFAVELADSQSKARRDVESKFQDRAKSSAALTESLFGSATTSAQAENAKRFGSAHVSPRTLAAAAKRGNNSYLLLLDKQGRIIASSPGTPPAVKRAVAAKPAYVRQALEGRPFTLSNLQRAGRAAPTLAYGQPFETAFGRRAIVSGLNAKLIYQFLGGYLKQVPNVEDGRAYVLDQHGRIVASPEKSTQPGAIVREPGLVAALASGNRGSFDGNRYRVADPVGGTPWRVVLTAPKGKLFATVSGTRKWVPWLLFVGFGLAAVVALVLLRRVLRDANKLSDANTELAGANQALERRAQELAYSNEHLERFASIASHDLQEPLRKLQTFGERLIEQEGPRLSDSGRDYLERMGGAARRMQALIDGLLAFSRTATMRATEEVQLTEIVEEVVADLEAVVNETGATVEVGLLPTVPGDPLRMRQLFQNLISNAIKFHRRGVPPVVRVEGTVDGDVAEIAVIDNGIGFEPRFAGRIFRVFERLHSRTDYAGTGIGLALCRRIVERHGGTISADSTPGEGSIFTVRLPLEPVEWTPPTAAPADTTEEETPLVSA